MKNILLFAVLCFYAAGRIAAQDNLQKPVSKRDSVKSLASITVSGRKPVLEKRGDRTVVNVDNMFSGAGTDALRLLEAVPGVTVDEDGNISLNGKQGVLVMIDNKPTYLSGDALANYLRSIPSSSLEKIELMPEPPAEFDAAGKAGVIHFKTKRNRNKGFNGNLSLAANQGVLFSTTNSLNVNYQWEKISGYAIISYVTQNRLNDLDLQRNYHDQWGNSTHYFIQNSYLRRKNHASAVKAGMDLSLNKRTTIGYGFSFLHRPSQQTIRNTSNLSGADGAVDSTIYANNHEEDEWNNKSFNLNFRRTIGVTGTLTADADYLDYRSYVNQGFVNTTMYPNRSLTITEEQAATLPSEISIAAGKLDFTTAISKVNLQAGVKSSRTITSNAASFYFVEGAAARPDYEKTNDFRYRENIHAAYVSVEGKVKRFSWKGGLRMESTRSNGHQLGNPAKPDSAFTNSYTNLFPTFFASYTPDTLNRHQFTFSYGRRIERPFYQDLNPYVTPLDKFTLYVGNPFLKPSFSNELSLSYTFDRNLVFTASYSASNNVFMEAIDLNGNTYVSRTANLGKNRILGLSVNAGLKATRWWSANVYAEVQRRQFEGRLFGGYMDTAGIYVGVNITNQFQLGSGWSAELSGSGRSSYLAGQVSLGSLWQMNTGVQKKLFNSKVSIKLSVRDIFYTGIRNGAIHYLYQAAATFRNRPDLRIASLSVSYNFGKTSASKRNRSAGSAQEEQDRVRQG